MCNACADKDERIAWLESELGIQRSVDAIERIRRALPRVKGMGRAPANLLSVLYAAQGRPLTVAAIMGAIPPPRASEDDRFDAIVSVWVCMARKFVGKDAIENVWGKGYRLTETGMAKVAEILGEASASRELSTPNRVASKHLGPLLVQDQPA